MEFEPAFPASKGQQTHAFERATTGIGQLNVTSVTIYWYNVHGFIFYGIPEIQHETFVLCSWREKFGILLEQKSVFNIYTTSLPHSKFTNACCRF